MTVSRHIDLEWTGPRRLPENLVGSRCIPEAAGVYLWTVLGPRKKDYIHYVGSSYNLRNRHLEHAVWHLGGGYWLPNLGDERQEGFLEEKHLGMPAKHSREDRYEFAFKRVVWLVKDDKNFKVARDILRRIRIYWARTDTPDEARDAEYIIQSNLQAMEPDDDRRPFLPNVSLQGSRPPKDRRVRLRHRGQVENIVGLRDLKQLPVSSE